MLIGNVKANHAISLFQLLVSGGQPTTATSPAMSSGGGLSPGALSPSSTATTTTTAGTGAGAGTGTAGASGGASTPVGSTAGPGTACCENGRPMMTDPVTGQTVCSCQYDSAARLALGAYPRLAPTATSYSSYPTPTPSATDQTPYPSIGMDSSAFYSPLVSKLKFFSYIVYSFFFRSIVNSHFAGEIDRPRLRQSTDNNRRRIVTAALTPYALR